MWWLVVVLCGARCYPNLWKLCGLSTVKKSKPPWCGGVVRWCSVVVWCGGVVVWCGGVVVWWCGGVVFITDYNTTLRLHLVTLGCGN